MRSTVNLFLFVFAIAIFASCSSSKEANEEQPHVPPAAEKGTALINAEIINIVESDDNFLIKAVAEKIWGYGPETREIKIGETIVCSLDKKSFPTMGKEMVEKIIVGNKVELGLKEAETNKVFGWDVLSFR